MWDPFMVLDCTQFKENHLNAVVHTTCALTNYHCCYSLGRVGPWFSPGASAWNYLSIHEEKCSWVAVFFFFFWILIWLFLVVILALKISQNLILSLHVETRKLNLSGKLAFMSMGYGNISLLYTDSDLSCHYKTSDAYKGALGLSAISERGNDFKFILFRVSNDGLCSNHKTNFRIWFRPDPNWPNQLTQPYNSN